jgi:hypothetical protein
MEIDRLTRLSGEQKRKIAELECSLVSEKVEQKTRMIEVYNQVMLININYF